MHGQAQKHYTTMVSKCGQYSCNLKDDEYSPMKVAKIFKSDVGGSANDRASRLIPGLVPTAGYQMIAGELGGDDG